jgi:5-methoxy-6-methylbenzimidazole methyltransferase
MKILLLEHPRSVVPERCNDIANTPLSSCLLTGYAAGMLKGKGHEVEIVEGYLDGLSYEEIASRVRAAKPDILGIHIVYHWQKDHALFRFLETMKRERNVSSITAYGFYATVAHESILGSCNAVDSVIVGEPEQPFADLAESASVRNYIPCVPGIAIRNGSVGVRLEKQVAVIDLDALPFPVRTEALYRLPEVNLLGSRGCYGSCTFCFVNSLQGGAAGSWRGRSPKNIVQEIDVIIAERGVRDFYFTDPNFFGPGRMGQERVLLLASLLKTRNIRFGIEGRVNDIHDETISSLVDAGLRHILIGLESGKDESLRRMNKMTTVAQNENALRILRRHGIEPNVGFIMFEPDSRLEDVRVNFDFLKRNDLLKNLSVTANVLYHHQIVLEGTQAYQDLKKDNRLELRTSYEGIAHPKNPVVADLADIMRQITNLLFSRMGGIWSGKMIEPPGMQERYVQVNRILVNVFETCLKALESGERFDNDLRASVVAETGKEIDEILNTDQDGVIAFKDLKEVN